MVDHPLLQINDVTDLDPPDLPLEDIVAPEPVGPLPPNQAVAVTTVAAAAAGN